MSDQDAWRYAQEMQLNPYNNVEPPRPTLQEWVRNVEIEGGRTPYLPPATDWQPGRFERPDPNMTPASPFAYNPFRDIQRAPEAAPQLPSGDDLTQFLTRQPPIHPRPTTVTPPPRTSPPAATPPPGDDLRQFMHNQPAPPRNAELPPTPRTSTPAPLPGETPQAPRTTAQPPTNRFPPTGAGTPPPPTASPRTPIPTNNPTPGARPSNVPVPRGVGPIAAGGALNAGADFVGRIFAGQDPKTAAGGAIFTGGGSVAGSIIGGYFGGPVGSFLGGMAGGYIGGAIYNNFIAPRPATPPQPQQPYTGEAPFKGGQTDAVKYRINGYLNRTNYPNPPQNGQNFGHGEDQSIPWSIVVWGPVQRIRTGFYEVAKGSTTTAPYVAVLCRGLFLENLSSPDRPLHRTPQEFKEYRQGYGVDDTRNLPNLSFTLTFFGREDGSPDNSGNPPPEPLPYDNRTPPSYYHPGNQDYPPPRGEPAPPPAPNNYAPGGIGDRTGGTPRGDSPNWVPHGHPSGSPHPNNAPAPIAPTPAPIAPGSPSATGAPPSDAPSPNRHGGSVKFDPNTGRVTFSTPGSLTNSNPAANPTDQAVPPAFEANPLTANPIKPSTSPEGFTNTSTPGQPAGLPQTGRQERADDGTREYPAAPPQPQPQTQAQTQNEQRITQLEDKIDELSIALVGLTQLLNPVSGQLTGIQNNTTPQAIQNAAAAGTCQTLQPGGCMVPLANNAANAANNANNAANNAAANGQKIDRLVNAADAAVGADTNLRVRNIENRVGANEYPMLLPEYLLDDFLDRQVVVNNQVQYNAWLLKQIDALVGLFPIKIERTDEDGKKETLTFENIAEAIAELTGLLAQIAFDADTAVNVATRATGEALGAKAATIQCGSYLKAIIDYLGFQTQDIGIDVPISVTPGAVGLDGKLQESELKDFLKPSTQRTVGAKNIDPVDQRLVIQRILQNTEIGRHAVYKPLKPFQSGENRITGDGITEDRKKDRERANARWEAFKRRMEGHTTGTRVDIDDGSQNPNSTNTP